MEEGIAGGRELFCILILVVVTGIYHQFNVIKLHRSLHRHKCLCVKTGEI